MTKVDTTKCKEHLAAAIAEWEGGPVWDFPATWGAFNDIQPLVYEVERLRAELGDVQKELDEMSEETRVRRGQSRRRIVDL